MGEAATIPESGVATELFLWRQRPALSTASLFSQEAAPVAAPVAPPVAPPEPLAPTSAASTNLLKGPRSPRSPILIIGDTSATSKWPRPSPSKITDVMAAVSDQTRSVQALKEAVDGVDSIKIESQSDAAFLANVSSLLSENQDRDQWRTRARQSPHSQQRSRSTGAVSEYAAFRRSFDDQKSDSTRVNGPPSPAGPPPSLYFSPTHAQLPPNLRSGLNTHRTFYPSSSVPVMPSAFQHARQAPQMQYYEPPVHLQSHMSGAQGPRPQPSSEFEQKMQSIVADAVQKAIQRDDQTSPHRNASYMDEVMSESASIISSNVTSPKSHHRRSSAAIRTKAGSFTKPKFVPKASHHNASPSSLLKRTSSNTPSNAPTPRLEKFEMATLMHQVEQLTAKVHEIEAQQVADAALDRFDVDKVIGRHVRAMESRMEALEARLSQMEHQEFIDRVGADSGTFASHTTLAQDLKLAQVTLNSLVQAKIPDMSAQTAHVARQLESLRNESRGAQADLAAAVVGLETQARDVQARLGECVEGVKVLQGRFDFQLVAMENLRNHVARGSTGGGGESGNDGKRVVEIASGLVDSSVKAAVAVETSTLRRAVGAKVDTAVLEELIRHLATRDELRRMYEKLQSTIGRSVKAREEEDEVVTERLQTRVMADLKRDVEVRVTNLKLEVKEMLKSNRAGMSGREGSHVSPAKESSGTSVSATELQDALNVLEHRWGQQLDRTLSQVGSNGFKIPDSLIEELREDLMDHVNLALNQHALDATGATVGTATAIGANKPIQSMLSAITREFDEKLYLLCTDLSACKTAYQAAARQPFYRCAQWLWTSGTLKLGSAVPWNLQTHNTDPENFIWESASHVIRILEPGLYEISFAFFDITWKPSVQVVVNGESVMSALNAPSYVVHHSSGFVRSGDGNVRPGTVTGLSLIDFMSLPAKSTVAIHYHGSKKEVVGHAFLGLRRL